MLREAVFHERQHLARHGVGREPGRLRQQPGAGLSEGAPVLGVEIPAASGRLVAVHQHAMALAHLAVEAFHQQPWPPARVGGELAHRAEEVPIHAEVERQSARCRDLAQRTQHAGVAGRGHDEGLRCETIDGRRQLAVERADVAWVVKARVVHRAPPRSGRVGEVAHRGEEQRRARLARPDMGRFLHDLGHPHAVAGRVEIVEGRGVEIQLVAQHDDEVPGHPVAPCLRRRHASQQ